MQDRQVAEIWQTKGQFAAKEKCKKPSVAGLGRGFIGIILADYKSFGQDKQQRDTKANP